MGFWVARTGQEPEWVEGDLNGDAYALTRQTKWYYTSRLTSWLPSLGGSLNQELPVYVSVQPAIARDIRTLRTVVENSAKGASHSLAPMMASLLAIYDSGIVQILHREERSEAFIELIKDQDVLYKVRYKTNDPDLAWRLSFLVHELVHAECDQRYRYHPSSASVPALNANGDEDDANNDFKLIKARLDEIIKRTEALEKVFDKVEDEGLKTHLKARLGRAGNNTNEWDTVMTELYLYLFLATSSDKAAMKAVRECAEDAVSQRHTHQPRGKTKRPGGIN